MNDTAVREQITSWTTKTPLDLTIGDMIFESGVVLRVVALNTEYTDNSTGRTVKNWKTEHVMGTAPWSDVDHWMRTGTFNIQGNDLARVAVVTLATLATQAAR